jgi:hypothetical protein
MQHTTALSIVEVPRYSRALHLAASRDAGRYATDHVLVDLDRSQIVASDGRLLAMSPINVSPAPIPTLGSYTIAATDFAAAVKRAKKGALYLNRIDESTVHAIGDEGALLGIYRAGDPQRFPRYDLLAAQTNPARGPHAAVIALNAELLAQLQRALGSEQVYLRIQLDPTHRDWSDRARDDGRKRTARYLVSPIVVHSFSSNWDAAPDGYLMPLGLGSATAPLPGSRVHVEPAPVPAPPCDETAHYRCEGAL